jgi:hypothetical protein
MRTGGGGTPPADAGQATASGSGGHPPAAAVSAADTNRPATDLVDTDRGSGSSSGQPRRPRCPVLQPPRHRPRGPAGAGRRRTRSRRCRATAGLRMSDLLVCSARLRWSSCQVDAASGTAVRMRGHRTRPAEHREPARPALRTPATAAGYGGHCGSGRAGQPAAGPFTTRSGVRPERDSNVRHRPPLCGTGHHARLTARSVVWRRPESQRRPGKAAQVRRGPPLR